MIQIEGLSSFEVSMLDVLWNVQTMEELRKMEKYVESNPAIHQCFVKCRDLLIAHQLDFEMNTDLAADYLKKFQLF